MLGGLDKETKIIYGIWVFVVASSILILPLISSSPALTDNIISYWKLDETSGTTAIDSVGSYNGTATNARVFTSEVAGIINTGADFSQGADKIIVSANEITQAAVLTINVWAYVSKNANWEIILQQSRKPGVFSTYLMKKSNNNIDFYRSGSGSWTITIPAADWPEDTWMMITITADGAGGQEIFLNGVSKDSVSGTNGLGSWTNPFVMGTEYDTTDLPFTGYLDEVGIWDVVLNSTEITQLWNDGDGNQYPFVVDTCTCAGAGNNWEIDMSDNCEIIEDCDLTTGTLSFTGAGWCKCDAEIKTTNLGDPGATGVLYILDDCRIKVS